MTNKTYKFLLKLAQNEIKEWNKFIIILDKEYEKETKQRNAK
jgi:hypothetical protein